ncbi:MAG: hypothetical protein B6D59_04080 [Campylobacteraceae bacterium 4484_4]|nr:MAG: hypothetical protein B6D59_04080 [Campylobacteraceae bacterium 4484_4]
MPKIILLFMLFVITLFASETVGKISAMRGDATLIRETSKLPLHTGDTLQRGDTIETEAKTRLQIIFNDHTVISLGQRTTFRINDYLFDTKAPKADFSITRGVFKSITGKIGKIAPKHFKLHTKNATIGIRGTTVLGEITNRKEMIACSYGKIVVTTLKESVSLIRGEKTYITDTLRPLPPRPLQKKEMQHFNLEVEPLPQSDTPSTESQSQSELSSRTTEKITDWESWEDTPVTVEHTEEGIDQIEETIIQKQSGYKELIERAGSSMPSYSGKVSGYVQNSMDATHMAIRNDETNAIRLQADLDHGSLTGEVRFTTEIGQRWHSNLSGTVARDATFQFQSDRYSGGGTGRLEGERLENAEGTFRLINDSQLGGITHTATGTFQATKEPK